MSRGLCFMKSYKDLALYDMRSVEASYEYGLWNKVGRESQQICEKYLKHYLQENHLLTEELGKSHNLKKLLKVIPSYDRDVYKQLSVITGYYYETNYPGENYIELDKEMADEAIDIAKSLMKYIDSLEINAE